MKVAPENIFPGARIKSGEITLTVVKVNQNTFYASEMNYAEFHCKHALIRRFIK